MAHAELSPSSAARWMTCPGSVAASRGIEDKGSAFADEGTDAHELAAICLINNTDAADNIGKTMGKGNVVSADMARHVQSYVDYVRDVVMGTGGELFVEQELSIAEITGEAGAVGTSDAVIVTDDEIIVIDLKYGMGEKVDA